MGFGKAKTDLTTVSVVGLYLVSNPNPPISSVTDEFVKPLEKGDPTGPLINRPTHRCIFSHKSSRTVGIRPCVTEVLSASVFNLLELHPVSVLTQRTLERRPAGVDQSWQLTFAYIVKWERSHIFSSLFRKLSLFAHSGGGRD